MSIRSRLEALESPAACRRCAGVQNTAVRRVYPPGAERENDPQPRPVLCPACGRDTLLVIVVQYVNAGRAAVASEDQ